MSNIASVLKEEIARLVRRQLRGETENLKKASSRYRADIAALKRRIEALEKQISRLEKMAPKKAAPIADQESETKLRFKPQGVRAQRTRLGLSAPEMGALVGEYSAPQFSIKVFINDKGRLMGQAPGQPAFELLATTPRQVHVPQVGAQLDFGAEEGKAGSATLTQGGQTLVMPRKL